jgi:hypothetical protein
VVAASLRSDRLGQLLGGPIPACLNSVPPPDARNASDPARMPQPPARAPCGRVPPLAGAGIPRIAWTGSIMPRAWLTKSCARTAPVPPCSGPFPCPASGESFPVPCPRSLPRAPSSLPQSCSSGPAPARCALRALSPFGGRTDSQDRMDRVHHAARMVNEALRANRPCSAMLPSLPVSGLGGIFSSPCLEARAPCPNPVPQAQPPPAAPCGRASFRRAHGFPPWHVFS